jgi:hypothetical protein
MIVRTEHSPKTFDVRDTNADLTIAVPFSAGTPRPRSSRRAPAHAVDRGEFGDGQDTGVVPERWKSRRGALLGSGSSAQPIVIAADASLRYASPPTRRRTCTIACSGAFVKTGRPR